jgi:hypothetical protein
MHIALGSAKRTAAVQTSSSYRLPLGLLIFSRGLIDQAELAAALRLQAQQKGLRIGECLCRLGLVNEEQVTRALGIQNGVPVLLAYWARTECVVPLRLQQAAEAYCVRAASNSSSVYAGFSSRVDQSLVQAVEALIGVPVEPCIVPSRMIRERLASMGETGSYGEIVFETRMRHSEMVDSVCSYARQVNAESIRISPTTSYLWARLRGTCDHDLLFRADVDN